MLISIVLLYHRFPILSTHFFNFVRLYKQRARPRYSNLYNALFWSIRPTAGQVLSVLAQQAKQVHELGAERLHRWADAYQRSKKIQSCRREAIKHATARTRAARLERLRRAIPRGSLRSATLSNYSTLR